MNNKYTKLIGLSIVTILLSACGGNNDEKSNPTDPSNPDNPTENIENQAFNEFTQDTFAKSTCKVLPIETPAGIFVSVDGLSTGSGTKDSPIDLQTALSKSSPAKPGETIWIKGGIYKGSYLSEVSGKSGLPISIKPIPGERVIIDSYNSGIKDAGLRVNGYWTNFYGIEARSSDTNRGNVNERYPDVSAKSGIAVFGANTNIYNCLSYDNVGGGIDFWKTATDSTLHGNIIYNNGFAHSGRGASHGVYTQNTNGYKNIKKNIFFFGFQTGLHPYSTGAAPLNRFTIEDNVWFLAGAADPRDNQQKTNLIVYTKSGIIDMVIKNNKGYSQVNRGTSLASSEITGNVSIIDNYLSERIEIGGLWDPIIFEDNTVYGNIDDPHEYLIDSPTNKLSKSRPTSGNKVFVDANEIDPRRGRIVIYNYDDADSVNVDLSSILKTGEAYRVHSVMGLFEGALVSGVYDGSEVSIPMGTINPPQPNGNPNGIDSDDGPKKKFGTFIVTHGGCI